MTSLSSVLSSGKTNSPVNVLKNLLLLVFLYKNTRWLITMISRHGALGLVQHTFKSLLGSALRAARSLPGASSKIDAEIAKTVASMESTMIVKPKQGEQTYRKLPQLGLDHERLKEELERFNNMGHVDWKQGRVSGAIYGFEPQIQSVIAEAFKSFTVTNPLHPDVFPGIRNMEASIISMTLQLYNAPENAVGNLTSGGTESILLACLACREYAREHRGMNGDWEIVAPVTVHAAFDKAAFYFGMKLIHVPIDDNTGVVDMKAYKRAISSRTVMLVGSAPQFPHGIIDPLPEISALALSRSIPFHVDACLGGFLLPFMSAAGFPLPHACDFSLPGVTSISADTHKYGFAPKGSSVLMCRSGGFRKYQYYVTTEWPGGIYATPTIAGSRPGALVAGCWATMVSIGYEGYVESTKKIVGALRDAKEKLSKIPQISIIGDPLVSVIAFTARAPMNTYALADLLTRKGWSLNILQNPPSIHVAITLLSAPVVDELVAHVRECVQTLQKDPNAGKGSVAAIYGSVASVPDRSLIRDAARGFCDILTKPV